jgi:DNA-binding transcriptional ArsR family regulator/uncharacterized protein YndB with AHSA1/START domain
MARARVGTRRARSSSASQVWQALADPTRRRILDLLRKSPRTAGQLASLFETSRFAIRKHLLVLEAAGLVVVRPSGRERWLHLNAMPLHTVYERWVTPYQAHWAGKLSRFKQSVERGGSMPASTPAMIQRVELQVPIAAPPADVWRALVDETTLWWPRDFYTGPARGFHIEPRLHGRVFEDWGDGNGVVWYQVFAISPGKSLDLSGCMAVPYGPAMTLLHIELVAEGKGTVLKVSDSTIGDVHGGAAAKTDGWRQVFEGGLKSYVEGQR